MPNLISSEVHENDAGEAMYRDPQSGRLCRPTATSMSSCAIPRTTRSRFLPERPNTNEGAAASAGALLGTGMAASPMSVSKAAPPAIGAAERIGVDVPKGIATDSPLTAFTAQVAARAPGGGPLMKAIEESRDALKGATGRAAEMAGGTTDAAIAGDNYAKAIEDIIQAGRQIRRQRCLR
jgi:hypothetical protein